MTDHPETTPTLPDGFRLRLHLTIAEGDAGLFCIWSDNPRGLLVADRTLAGALAMVPQALAELRDAGAAMPQLEGVQLP